MAANGVRLSVLMTVYNEGDFIEQAIRSCLPHVDDLVIVEGAYQETIALGAKPRSTDGTIEIIENFFDEPQPKSTFRVINANEESDKDQRNVGLEKIKEVNPDGWLLIIDGDEVYDKMTLQMVKSCAKTMDNQGKLAAYFKSVTFVNDLKHYTEQTFPRLFKITPKCQFINDNFMTWPEKNALWGHPFVLKIPYISYHHYAFVKGSERFDLKKKWWESRFDGDFDYGWHKDEDGLIDDPNHEIYEYTGKHPRTMETHPLWKETYK